MTDRNPRLMEDKTTPVQISADGWFVPWDEKKLEERIIAEGGVIQGDHLGHALRHVRQFGVAIDGGAHVGTWSVALAARFKRVWAFEPVPQVFECLIRNVFNKRLVNGEVVLVFGALGGATDCGMPVELPGASLGNYFAAYKAGPIPSFPLDRLGLAPDFIKLDLEGSECWALEGMRETLARCKPVVLVEWKPYKMGLNGGTAERAHELLTECGLTHAETVGQDRIYVPA